MINNTNFSKWRRISAKSIDSQFMIEMQQGLNCSPFEAKIMVEKVHEFYRPLFETSLNIKPGQIQTMVLDIDALPGVPLTKQNKNL